MAAMPFGDQFRRPRPDLLGSQEPTKLPNLQPTPYVPGTRPNPDTAPAGAVLGHQSGVDANPRFKAYETFLNSAAAEERRRKPGGKMGERIWQTPPLGG